MKKLVILALLLILSGVVLSKKERISEYLKNIPFFNKDIIVTLDTKNEYYRNYDFDYVQNTENFSPHCKQDLLNIYYTVLNAGKNEFTFYCPKDYEDCTTDIKNLVNDETTLSDINNFIHPYNGFQHIETEYDNYGKVTITIIKSYTNDQIIKINAEVDKIYQDLNLENLSQKDAIKKVHDYIIDTTTYDSDRTDKNIIKYSSDIAYGPLFEKYGICGGYSDTMELFLEKMNIESYKISSEKHVWNAVYLDGTWYHLDLTWDDPVISDGTQIIDNAYFLIDTKKLLSLEIEEHNYDQEIYYELKEA